MTARRSTRVLALLTASLLLVAACGGGDDDGTAAPGTDPVEEGEPVRGGTLTVAESSDVDSLDPLSGAAYNIHRRVGMSYGRLITFDTGPDIGPYQQILVGDLAERWDISDDGLTYTFHLRDDVTWHDVAPVSGRPFVAADVVATLRTIQERGFQRYMLTNVTGIEAPDDHTVVLTLSAPFAPLINFMANHHMWILPEEAFDGRVDPAATVIGTGPFVMTTRERNVETSYVRNPDYHRGAPHLDGVRMLVIPDGTARTAGFRAGEIDYIATGMSPEEADALSRTNPDTVWYQARGSGHQQLYLNATREPFDDLRVRQAINHAIDREGMGEAIYGGALYTGPVFPSLGDWVLDQGELSAFQEHDPDRARELLAEAGLAAGFDTGLMITSGYGEQVVRMAQWIVQDLAEVGIRATIETLEYATYIGSRWPNLDYDMGVGPQTGFLEVDEWLRGQFHTDGPRNWWGVSDPELDAMLEEQITILDQDERRDFNQDVQRYILEEVMNPVPMLAPDSQTPRQPWVQGWYNHASYGNIWFHQVWIDR